MKKPWVKVSMLLSSVACVFSHAYGFVVLPPSQPQSFAQQKQEMQQLIHIKENQIQESINDIVKLRVKLALLQQSVNKTKDVLWAPISPQQAVPKHAVVAVQGKAKPIYICQAAYADDLYPGRWVGKGCLISYAGGAKLIKSGARVLINKQAKLYWVNGDKVPAEKTMAVEQYAPSWSHPTLPFVMFNHQQGSADKQDSQKASKPTAKGQPVYGGYENNHYLYICRTQYQGQWYVGKVVTGVCDIAYQGKEASLPNFEVLFSEPERS